MDKNAPTQQTDAPPSKIQGTHAILGIDMVSFSTLADEDQLEVIRRMYIWIQRSLDGEGISEDEFRWSPAGDGGYVSFISHRACKKAIDVAFAIFNKSQRPDWTPRDRKQLEFRFAVHAGLIEDGEELGGYKNVWGAGIIVTARMLSVTAPSQILVSKEYYDQYIESSGRKKQFEISSLYSRTVKHGERIEVMNIAHQNAGLPTDQAENTRWKTVWDFREKFVQDFELLMEDAMRSGNPLAALATAKLLLQLGRETPAEELCRMIHQYGEKPKGINYPPQTHHLLGQIPDQKLLEILTQAKLVTPKAGEILCRKGEPSNSTFFLISGCLNVEDIPGRDTFRVTPEAEIFGEFSLWIPEIKRTATLRADTDCLLLEIDSKYFREEVLQKCPAAETVVHGIIQRRIIENARDTGALFPKFKQSSRLSEEAKEIQEIYDAAKCEIRPKDYKLDLKERVYIVFNGEVKITPSISKVKITPPNDPGNKNSEPITITISGEGETGAKQLVGIVSEISSDSIDGDSSEPITITISGEGETGAKQLVGIVSEISSDSIDGDSAEVVDKPAVLISFDRNRLVNLLGNDSAEQNGKKPRNWDSSNIVEHWNGLYGKRCAEIVREVNRPREQSRPKDKKLEIAESETKDSTDS